MLMTINDGLCCYDAGDKIRVLLLVPSCFYKMLHARKEEMSQKRERDGMRVPLPGIRLLQAHTSH